MFFEKSENRIYSFVYRKKKKILLEPIYENIIIINPYIPNMIFFYTSYTIYYDLCIKLCWQQKKLYLLFYL